MTDILQAVGAYGARYVCVTGGEPLAQPGSRVLLSQLCEMGYAVSLETSGALSIADIDPRVSIVMDLKTPDSGERARNRYENISLLTSKDQVKFVIGSREDYIWSRDLVANYALGDRCEVLFSPSHGQVPPADLADWVLADRLQQVRVQIQLHKVLWGETRGR